MHEVNACHNTDDDRHNALLCNAAAGKMRETSVSARTTEIDTDIIHDNACNTSPTGRNAQCSEMHKSTNTRRDLTGRNETGNNAADVFIEPRSPDAATKTKPNTSGSTVVHQPVLCSYGTTATAAKPTSATQTDTDCVSSTFDLYAQTSSDKQTEQLIELPTGSTKTDIRDTNGTDIVDGTVETVQTRAMTRRKTAGKPDGTETRTHPGLDQRPPPPTTADRDRPLDTEQTEIQRLSNIDITDSTDDSDKWPGQCVSETAFQRAQQSDPTLQSYWVRAKMNSNEFVIFGGILYKKTPGHILSEHEYVLVVPSEYHDQLLNMAHNSKAGAHLGIRKTLDRIQSVFFFPRMRQKIKDHIKACGECQFTAPIRKNERQPLQHVHVLDKYPFSSITIDFLGSQLPKTKSGNRYLLVIICNATRFICAYPMKKNDSRRSCRYSSPILLHVFNCKTNIYG